jgi:diguanylate cyclase
LVNGLVIMFKRKRQSVPTARPLVEVASGVGYEALAFLTQHELEHTPANYVLAHRVKADRRSLVAMAIDTILMDGRTLRQADVDRIMLADAQRGRPKADVPDPHQEALRHQTLRLADLTAGAVVQSSDFGRDLSSGLTELAGNPNAVERIVAAMVQRTRVVEDRLVRASGEIEALREQVETFRDDAYRDALTGLLNRRGMLHELSERQPSHRGVIAMCEVDHFKLINDRHGHAVGDRVLKGVAASISESIGVHVVARWGGEEFLILADGIDMGAGATLFEQARQDLAARAFKVRETGEPLGAVTVSIGAATLADKSLEEAIEAADQMLYAAKRRGQSMVITDHPLADA